MLELSEVTIAYGRAVAVREVTLSVSEGESVSLVGPNGAGKTTTLSAIAGLLGTQSGAIKFASEDLRGVSPENRVRRGLALVPEGRQILTTLTVGENLRLPTALLPAGEADGAIARELERFPALATRLDDPAGGLSGGQQQMLAIARALICRPRLLLLDEPSLGLAPKLVDTVFEALERLRDEGVTILLVEQNAIRAARFADRTYVLNAGRIVLEGDRTQMDDADLLTESYLRGGR